jgi:hypothetical protein
MNIFGSLENRTEESRGASSAVDFSRARSNCDISESNLLLVAFRTGRMPAIGLMRQANAAENLDKTGIRAKVIELEALSQLYQRL